jgi:hypothetical protein
MIVRTSFVLSGLTLLGVAVVLYGLARGMVGWAVRSVHLLFMRFGIDLLLGFLLVLQKLAGLYDWLIDDFILTLHHSFILPQDQLLGG